MPADSGLVGTAVGDESQQQSFVVADPVSKCGAGRGDRFEEPDCGESFA